ncbi:MAG: PilZ domain-containing protein [Myxococcales bacterium]|nr:PilZ domain-containing protein [Myxococcales bacterium]
MNGSSHFRKDGRRALTLRVHVRQGHATDASPYQAELLDLGMGGAFVCTDEAPIIGSTVVLTINAATAWEPFEINAEVRWLSTGTATRPRGFGVHFLPIGSTEAAALYDLIQAIGFSASPLDT